MGKLHLGCGNDVWEGWTNLDCVALPGVDVVADLDACASKPLPFEDDSISEFHANHVLEHLNHPLPFMQELHRIATPDAKATFCTPYGASDDAHEDPTHVRLLFVNSYAYFSQPTYWRADYGYKGDWQVETLSLTVDAARYGGREPQEIMEDVNQLRNVVKSMKADLRAVKPSRAPLRELHVPGQIKFVLE